jgi:segregation and condensation protein B
MEGQNSELRNILEAALLAAEEPLSVSDLGALFPDDARPSPAQLKEVLEQLDEDYDGRGVELKRVGKGYRFQSREKYSPWLRKLTESRPPRYSRAFLETLAIIAYRQPVTRGDIEEIRGVSVSSDIMRQLLDRDWVKEVGHRDVPGRPALLGTTQQFLEYFNLEALSDLPPLLERREASDIARELNLRLPLEGEQDDGDKAEVRTGEETEAPVDGSDGEATSAETGAEEGADGQPEPATRPTAQVIPIDDAMTSREGDGEAS